MALWLSEDEQKDESEGGGVAEGCRPYARTQFELWVIRMAYDDLAIFFLFWIQHQVYLAYVFEIFIKPMVLKKLVMKYESYYQLWGM